MKNLTPLLLVTIFTTLLLTACTRTDADLPIPVQTTAQMRQADCRGLFNVDINYPKRVQAERPSLTLNVTPVSDTSVVASWNKRGRTWYTLTRDGAAVHTCQCNGFTDTGLQPGRTYTYQVNNSNTVTVTMPSAPTTGKVKVILLDFDGEWITGTSFNYAGDFYVEPSGLSQGGIDSVTAGVRAGLDTFPVVVTTDEALFLATDPSDRQRHVITQSWEWFAAAGGVAFINSFGASTGREEPSFTFSSLLAYRIKDITFATVHELGHTLGLWHAVDFCGQSYSTGPYYMGGNYQQLTYSFRAWGLNDQCIWVNEYSVIFNKLR